MAWRHQASALRAQSEAAGERRPNVTATKGWSDVPTCVEQGLDIPEFSAAAHGLSCWGKVSPGIDRFYMSICRKKVQATPEWKGNIEKTSANRDGPRLALSSRAFIMGIPTIARDKRRRTGLASQTSRRIGSDGRNEPRGLTIGEA